jgi:hypothetical protein
MLVRLRPAALLAYVRESALLTSDWRVSPFLANVAARETVTLIWESLMSSRDFRALSLELPA